MSELFNLPERQEEDLETVAAEEDWRATQDAWEEERTETLRSHGGFPMEDE